MECGLLLIRGETNGFADEGDVSLLQFHLFKLIEDVGQASAFHELHDNLLFD